jgi:hypothetical protein
VTLVTGYRPEEGFDEIATFGDKRAEVIFGAPQTSLFFNPDKNSTEFLLPIFVPKKARCRTV